MVWSLSTHSLPNSGETLKGLLFPLKEIEMLSFSWVAHLKRANE